MLAATLWVAIWWITEAIPISVTALLPIVLLPLFGGVNIADVTASYGHKYIFLYMGGFILAIAIELGFRPGFDSLQSRFEDFLPITLTPRKFHN